MFDVSCLYHSSKQEFSSIQEDAFQFWTQQQGNDPLGKQVAQEVKQKWNIDVIGQHYFVEENNQLVPVFDFSSTGRHKGDSKAIFFGKKTEDVPSRDGNDNVDWLELQNVSGELASTIYRVYTVKGQPPAKVSSVRPLGLCLSYSITFFFCSAIPDPISLSSILHYIVRIHDVMISAWPLLTARI
jgi:hypothetical protein